MERVQSEQPLDTGQSILRLRGNPIKLCGVFFLAKTATLAERE